MPAPPATPLVRWSRALVVALVATGVGIVAHVSAGGLVPGPPPMLVLVGVLTTASAVVLGQPASRATITVLVAGGQLLVHLTLTAMTGHPGATSPGPPHAATGGSPHWVGHLREDLTGPSLAMALAHLAAAAGVAAWLATGEQALWALIVLWGARLTLPLSIHARLDPPAPSARTSRPRALGELAAYAAAVRRRQTATNGATGRRGPPARPALLLDASTT